MRGTNVPSTVHPRVCGGNSYIGYTNVETYLDLQFGSSRLTTYRGSDSNGAKSHVKGRSWDRLASQDLSPSVSQGTIWRYVAVDGRLGDA